MSAVPDIPLKYSSKYFILFSSGLRIGPRPRANNCGNTNPANDGIFHLYIRNICVASIFPLPRNILPFKSC